MGLKSEIDLAVTLGEDGEFSFVAPSAPLDLRIAAAGLAPAYRWKASPREGVVDIGRLELVPGGSMLGYVVDTETDYPVPGAKVSVLPADLDALPAEDRAARANMAPPPTLTDERGAFQLLSLTPGAYRLRVEHTGYLTVEPAAVQIVRDAETLLGGNIMISPPLSLRLLIDPPTAPAGHPWQVQIRGAGREVVEAETDALGIAVLERLAAGTLEVVVGSEDVHDAFETRLELRADRDLVVEIPMVEVVGQVTMNDEPVLGRIVLSTATGDGWGASLDEEGGLSHLDT